MEGCCKRTKKRGEEEYKRLVNRLSRIEGQIRGITRMVNEEAYCNDILIQVAAVQSAISAFSKELLTQHVKECVVNDIKEGKGETVDELIETVGRLLK